ncbi:MAG: tetratricopeptide repeat protein [Pirellulales bacterium]
MGEDSRSATSGCTNSANPKSFFNVNFTDNKLPWNDTGGHGKRALENVRLDNPIGKLSDDATMRLAVSYYEKEDWEMAATTFGELRMTYPDSEHQFKGTVLELQSLLAAYMGPEYSDLHLIEADKRAKAIIKQFPRTLRPNSLSCVKQPPKSSSTWPSGSGIAPTIAICKVRILPAKCT